MKRIACIFLSLFLTICLYGCKETETNDNTVSEIKVVFPTDDTVGGYKEPKKENSKNKEEITYYANIKTKKFHLADCQYAKKTSAEHTHTTKDKDGLIERGYTPCKICNP